MNANIHKRKGFIAAMSVVLLLCVACSPVLLSEESDAANPATTINVQPGQSWSWTPTFTSGLSPTVTVSASASAMPADNATFGATSGNASVSNGKVTVSIPSDFSGSKYYVKVKAATTNPTQTVYYEITFNVATFGLSYTYSSVVAKVGTAVSENSPTLSGGVTAKSYAISPSLPTGMSFNTSTGKITGTPTAYKAQTTYTITATLNTVPVQTVQTTVSIGAFTNLSASNYTVYAIKGTTSISVPAYTAPTGTVIDSMDLSVKKDNTAGTITAGTAYSGMTVTAKTGAISGTPSAAGTYVFTETYHATAATGGSQSARTVTVVVEDKVAISGGSSMNSYVNHSDTLALTKSAGPSGVAWSISALKQGSSNYTNPSSNGFSVSNGTLTCGTAIPAGTYTVTVKLATTNTTATTSGATGAKVSDNAVTKNITVTVAPAITATGGDFYMAVGGAYDAKSVTSNISGATFTVTDYGTLNNTNIAVASNGAITPGATSPNAGDYTITVQAKDPNNATNVATCTVSVHVAPQLAYTNSPTAGAIAN